MSAIYTPKAPKVVRVPDMTQGVRGEVVIKEETAMHGDTPVVLFSSPGRVGIYVLAEDLVSGTVTHAEAYDALLNSNCVSQPHNVLQ